MDGMMLLREAQAAGLAVAAEGPKLIIRGPKQAKPLALLLLDRKSEIMAVLAETARALREWLAGVDLLRGMDCPPGVPLARWRALSAMASALLRRQFQQVRRLDL